MKRIGLLLSFLALLIFVLPQLTAQDTKKGAGKKTQKKADDAKDDKKDDEPKKEKLVYGKKFFTKVTNISPGNNRDITVDIQEVDPKKVYDLNLWKAQQSQQLLQQQFAVARANTFQARAQAMQNYQKTQYNFQVELFKRQNNIYTTKPWDIRAADNVKIRTMQLPVEFDDMGFEKKFTKKELEERKDKTGLPGYAAEMDHLKNGQMVELYMAKVAPAPKADPKNAKKKKAPDDEPPPPPERPEFVMIVILPSPPMRK